MTTAKNKDLTLRDKLSRLTYTQACRLLGPKGKGLLLAGGRYDLDLASVELGPHSYDVSTERAVVRIFLRDEVSGRLAFDCSLCDEACEHGGAAFSFILEEKLALGFARPPRERVPVESLGQEELVERALADREE